MPVLIPLALNTGFYIHFLIHKFKIIKSKKEQFPVYFNFGIIGLCAILTPLFIYFLLENNLEQYFLNYILTGISFIIIGITILISLFKKNTKNLFYLTVLFMVSILLFGLPLSKVFNKNDSYYPLSNLHNIENNLNIETYSFGEITPELIWDYKGIIIDIYRSNELILPKDLKFGILISENEIENLKNLIGSKYRLEFKETYNQNVGSKTKERLIRQFYLVSKK